MISTALKHQEYHPDCTPRGFVVDVSGRAIVALTGADAQDLLQRLSTNDVSRLRKGESTQTILTSEKGRIVEVVSAVKLDEGRILLVGVSTQSDNLVRWIERYIIMENAKVEAATSDFSHFLIYGAQIEGDPRELQGLTEGSIVYREEWTGIRLYHSLLKASKAEDPERIFGGFGFRIAGLNEFEEFRIFNGIPGHPNELSELYNPLEANLGSLISWTKGCYIGQEVIARLDTYKKVQRRLRKLAFEVFPDTLPQIMYSDNGEVGVITSTVRLGNEQGFRGLGFIRVGHPENGAEELFFHRQGEVVPVRLCDTQD